MIMIQLDGYSDNRILRTSETKFFMVHFMNFILCMLLLVHHSDGYMVMIQLDGYSGSRILKTSETQFLQASDIIFLGSLYSANIILQVLIKLSALRLSMSLTTGVL